MLDRLKHKVLGFPIKRGAYGVTEREWFKWCERLWHTILKDKDIADYYFRLQQTVYSGAGGW